MLQKIKLILFSFFILAFSHAGIAQNETVNHIAAAFKVGNAEQLASHLAPNVSIGIDKSEKSYSKAQAVQVLRSFFERNKAVDFTFRHSGKSEQRDQFNVGRLTTKNGLYRVTFFLIKSPEGPKIKRLRIDPK